jgi:hypothetical protein
VPKDQRYKTLNTNIISQIASAERVMSAGKSNGLIKDNGSIAKIAAALYYEAASLDYLVNSSLTQKAVKTQIFNSINKNFGFYVDAQARSYTERLHHVYEWSKPGNPSARLWKLDMGNYRGYDMTIGYSFKQSRSTVPSTTSLKKYVFKEKARIMEYRIPVTIKPKAASVRLAFEGRDGKLVVLPKGMIVRVANPGGNKVFSGFGKTYERFMKGAMVASSIDDSGVKPRVTKATRSATKIPASISSRISIGKISPQAVRSLAKSSATREAARI